MMIVLSPTKTHQVEIQAPLKPLDPRFIEASQRLRALLGAWTKDEMKSRMKLSDALTEEVYGIYQEKSSETATAMTYYTGLVYKQLPLSDYGKDSWTFIASHIRILSAMYGVLRPQDRVQPYRMDFLTKWPGMDLYGYWREVMEGYWRGETIVDLSSKEYGKMLPDDRIRILFLQLDKKGEWKSQSTKTKMARGRMLRWMIQRQIKTPQAIQAFDLDGYVFDCKASTDGRWVFKQV